MKNRLVPQYSIPRYKEFKKFLADECFDLKKYKEGKYNKIIYNWFLNNFYEE